MRRTITSQQMRDLEAAAIASGDVSGPEVMEKDGRGVYDAICQRWPECTAAVVLAGPGNNGGDGYVAARLMNDAGWDVSLFHMGDPAKLPVDAADMRAKAPDSKPLTAEALCRAGCCAQDLGHENWIVVDALFGIGQRAPLDTALAPVDALLTATFGEGAAPAPFFAAVDLPTGYDADSGLALAERPFPADLIVTFHAPKPLHHMPHMADAEVVVVDIGLGGHD